jgi:hypothetical protein
MKEAINKIFQELRDMDDEMFRCLLEESKRSDLHHALMYGWDYNYVPEEAPPRHLAWERNW